MKGLILNPAGFNINATLASNLVRLVFGVDGLTPANKIDFVTVLHEIGHGLGVSGSMSVTSGVGSWGSSGSQRIYDDWTVDSAIHYLTDTLWFANPSVALEMRFGQTTFFKWISGL